jgi:hypothetical protein
MAGRYVVVLIHRSEPELLEVVGSFMTRGKAFAYMDRITTKNPHMFKSSKVRPIAKPDPKIEKAYPE